MSSSYEKNSPVRVTLTVTVEKEDVSKAIEKAYATLRRTAQVRGFRKGKAPRAVLQRLYGPAVMQEVLNDLINGQLLSAMLEHELDPLSQPELDLPELNAKEPFTFKASFEVRPKIDKVEYEGIELERLKVTVAQEDIDDELEKVRKTLASVSDLAEARPAGKGDVAFVKMKRWADGDWEDGGFPEQEIVVGDGQAPDKIDEALLGMNVGDEKVVDMGSESDLEESRMRYLLTLTALKERQLPALDDELAKDTGKYETLDELKADIEKKLLEARNQREDQRLRQALFQKLRERNPIELPPSLVQRHAQALAAQLAGQFGGALPDDKAQEIIKGLEASTRKSAEEMVHQSLITLAIAKLENIKVEDADVDNEIESQAEVAGIPVPMLKAELNKEGRRQEMVNFLLERKIFDFAKSSVTITEVDELTVAEPKQSDADSKPTEDTTDDEVVEAVSEEPEVEPETGGKSTKKKTTTAKSTTNTASKKTTEAASKKKPAAKKPAAKKVAAKKTVAKKTAAKKTASKTEKAEE